MTGCRGLNEFWCVLRCSNDTEFKISTCNSQCLGSRMETRSTLSNTTNLRIRKDAIKWIPSRRELRLLLRNCGLGALVRTVIYRAQGYHPQTTRPHMLSIAQAGIRRAQVGVVSAGRSVQLCPRSIACQKRTGKRSSSRSTMAGYKASSPFVDMIPRLDGVLPAWHGVYVMRHIPRLHPTCPCPHDHGSGRNSIQ